MKEEPARKKAYIYLLVGILLLGTGPMFVKSVNASGVVIAFYRLFFAGLIMTAPALKQISRNWRRKKKPANPVWPILGGLAFALNITLWSIALKYTTASAVTLLDNTAPLWIGLFSFLVLGEKRGWKYWFGLAAAMIGAGVFIGTDLFTGGTLRMTGNLIGIASGISYAAYLLVTKKARDMQPSLKYSWLVSVIGAIALLPISAAIGGFHEAISYQEYSLIFIMALTSQVIAWILINQAMGELPAATSSIALVGQPIVSTVLGVIILNEVSTFFQLAGGVLCMCGIVIAQRSSYLK